MLGMASSECGLLRADNSSHKGSSGSYFNGDLYTAATDVGVLEIMLQHPYSAISGVLRLDSRPEKPAPDTCPADIFPVAAPRPPNALLRHRGMVD